MTSRQAGVQATCRGPARDYRSLSLPELADRIVEHADRLALRELQDNRPLFRLKGSPPMLLAEFVDALRDTSWAQGLAGYDHEVLERAYDLTIDKFANLSKERDFRPHLKCAELDCRYNFKAFLKAAGKWVEEDPGAHPLQREAAAARILQRLVANHFRLSCMEAKRSTNPMRSRYGWHVDGGTINVWMPVSVQRNARRTWLEANVVDPDPSRPDEQLRVQSIIDKRLGVPHLVSLNHQHYGATRTRPHDETPALSIQAKIDARGLTTVVADEKAENMDRQRPAIRALGESALRQLIRCILGDLSDGCYEEKRLAQAFGLSRATFSRFAGSRWRTHPSARPPDLWANVAQTIANHQPLVEAAKDAGVWGRVEHLLQENAPLRTRRPPDA